MLVLLGGLLAPVQVHYRAAQLQCARFHEVITGKVQTQTAGRRRVETLGRDGIWTLRANDSEGEIEVVGWYDSLSVWRAASDGKLTGDTDGLIGGRYRVRLSRSGSATVVSQPFIPDELREVADFSDALAELLPQVPPRPLEAGETWTDSAGLEIRRLADSVAAGSTIVRLEVHDRHETTKAPLENDTASVELQQTTEERGQIDWATGVGLMRRQRDILVETAIPPRGPIRQPVRSRLEQHISITRLKRAAPGRCQ
ncbi:MAG TPA: hypothetical protein VH763_00955 [Gemmatimonadales bacterium]|jgi:hypothetical protein